MKLDAPEGIPMACLPGGEIVESSQGEINFNAPDNLPFDFKFCEIHIRNPEDANEIVLIDFYNIFDIRTKQDCSFYVEVYSGEVPLVRLCGGGEHPPVAGRDLKIRIEGKFIFDIIKPHAVRRDS